VAHTRASIDSPKAEPSAVLSGWKDIANYLGKGVRTVQRYERKLGLPVRRPAGKLRGAVVATKAEIDAWVSTSPIQEAYEIERRVARLAQSLVSEIKNSIETMCRLCDEMHALQSELPDISRFAAPASPRSSRKTVSDREGQPNPLNVLGSDSRRCRIIELLAMDTGQRKVN